MKCHKGNDIWATAVLSVNTMPSVSETPDCIQKTVDSFADIFQDPTGLPPHRGFDHAISLLPNTTPVNVRPYRYFPLQKDEIER